MSLCMCVQVASIVLEWVNNHFSDFETDANLSEFLEQLESLMEKQVCTLWLQYNGIVYTRDMQVFDKQLETD